MKRSRSATRRKAFAQPVLRFEETADHSLTSFAGLIVFHQLFQTLALRRRLHACFRHLGGQAIYGTATVFLQLILHILLGFRELSACEHYRHDPMVKRVLNLEHIPTAATISRHLSELDDPAIDKLRATQRDLVMETIEPLGLVRITLDFDGSVQSTKRFAEGTAVGYNTRKKGQRGYYPLFCTIAQTGQVFDFHHRPGNVHDSRDARQFMQACIAHIWSLLPNATIEVRIDAAFFSDEIVRFLDKAGIEFTVSVPFERFPALKQQIESQRRWKRAGAGFEYFEPRWKPESWSRRFRMIVVRQKVRERRKAEVQLDLFVPHDERYEFKVIATNKQIKARYAVRFHEGRGAQETIFGEAKSNGFMGYIPCRRRVANQAYLLASLFAHNLTRLLQVRADQPARRTTPQRTPLWRFETLATVRQTIVQRAGRLTRPRGMLTLTIAAGDHLRDRIYQLLSHAPSPR